MKDINLQAIWNKHKLQRKNNSKNNIYKLHILTVKVGGNLKIYETPKTTDFYTVIIFWIAKKKKKLLQISPQRRSSLYECSAVVCPHFLKKKVPHKTWHCDKQFFCVCIYDT